MLIALAKRKSNIVEYLLYMYQIEDIIRSFQLNLDLIDQAIVQQYNQTEEVKRKIREWYRQLILEMRTEGIQQKGHLKQLSAIIDELQGLHASLLTTFQNQIYIEKYDLAKPRLKELVLKSGGQHLRNEIDVALNGLYGLLVLRLKKQTIAAETESAMKQISDFLAQLALQYKRFEAGELRLSKEKNN